MENATSLKRRWLRLSLRTFFVLVTAICLLLGWKCTSAVQQREAVESIRKSGGGFTYDYQQTKTDLADLPGRPWLRNLLGIDFFTDVIQADCHDTLFEDIVAIGKLRRLQRLNLNGTRVKNLLPLANLTNLQVLECRETTVSDISSLRRCRGLRFLQLNNTDVSDLSPLARLNQLEELYLQNTNVQDVSALESLVSLEFLGLRGTRVSDIAPLRNLTSLKWMDLRGTPAAPEDLQALQKSLPKCNIEFDRSELQ